MKKTLLFIVLALLCLNFGGYAQNSTSNSSGDIQGLVIDEQGQPLPGATIKNNANRNSTTTNREGVFTLRNIPENTTITASFIGYSVGVGNASIGVKLVLQLKKNLSSLDEVQVIAYGKTTKRFNTGNVATVTAAEIEQQPVTNVLAAIEGRIPGMVVTQTSGVPGSSFNVQIRGQSALDLALSKNDPLIIIDGVPFESGISPTNEIASAANNPVSISSGGVSPLNSINPHDIESVDVLKDADATAIYGSRGANGVILITTKKGKPGATKADVRFNSGVSMVGRTMTMLNTQQYVAMRNEALNNDGFTASSNSADPGYAPDIILWDNNRYTDFKKLLIGNTAHNVDAQASISGGTENTTFLLGGGYHRETTVYPCDFADAIASMHVSINHTSIDKRFNLSFTAMYSNDNNAMPQTDLTRYINLPPNLKLYDGNGQLAWQDQGVVYNTLQNLTDPLALLNAKYHSTNDNLLGNMQISYHILKNLVVRSSFSYNTFNTDESVINPSTSIDPTIGVLPSASNANAFNRNWTIEPQIEYSRSANHDKLDILLGETFENKSGKSNYLEGDNYNSDLLLNSIAAAPFLTASNEYAQYRYTAFFGRINYNLCDKYIIDLTARRDGSSRFAPENRFANFGAIGAAWIFSSENFAKTYMSFLSFGKLRGSYGLTGNDQIGDYKFLNLWGNTSNVYNGITGLKPTSLYNPDYQWEINKKFETSVDLGFFKDRLLVSASYYNNRSSNQLINYIIPNQTGFSSVTKNLPALVQNSGFEFIVKMKNIRNNKFSWNTSFNITLPKNELLSFPGLSTSSYANKYVIGQSLNLINAYKYTGVDPQTGLYTILDKNGDGKFTTADYQVSGNTDPKFYGGIQNNIRYKQFDLNFFFMFRKQTGTSYVKQLASTPPGWIYNQPVIALNRWQKPGDIAPVEKYTSGFTSTLNAASYLSLSDGAYTEASFVRLKNVSLSYRIPESWLKRYGVAGCRLYLEGQNLITFTNYVGSDPESQNFYVLPPLKSVVAGLQFTL